MADSTTFSADPDALLADELPNGSLLTGPPLGTSLRVTHELRQSLLEPLLWQLRAERCAHLWQPALAAAPMSQSFQVLEGLLAADRRATVFTYYVSRDGQDEAVAVATIRPRITADTPEDGIAVLGRLYVHPGYRGRSMCRLALQHRLHLCWSRWGRRLFGVHLGTASPRVERVFRDSFPGRTIRLGREDLGAAGTVTALIGLTAEFDRQVALPVPPPLAAGHRLLRDYLLRGAEAMPVSEALPALRTLIGHQDAYRVFDQFLSAMPALR